MPKRPKRVLITGATGLIGARLCEVAVLTGAFEPRALVHSTASAARIMRFPIDSVLGDLCDRNSVEEAVRGCDAVVHLARGDNAVMRTGLKNVLRASTAAGVSRFVHISSVAVYGHNPPPESVAESAPAKRGEMLYGNEKLDQERRVLKYSKHRNLPIVILRPPNVYGPFAHFTLDLLNRIRSHRIAILDGGHNPCNLVYVDNLVEAILLALWKREAVGEIFFVTDREAISWKRCVNDHAALLGMTVPFVASSTLITPRRERIFHDSLRAVPRVLLSGELRRLLRGIPAFKAIEAPVYNWFQNLPKQMQQTIRLSVSGPMAIQHNGHLPGQFAEDDPFIAFQRRAVAHSSEKARRLLGYTAGVSYQEGMTMTEAWLRYAGLI